MEHSRLFLLESFLKNILDQTICSLFRTPGSWVPRRLVRVAFYVCRFSFSSSALFTSVEGFSVSSHDNVSGVMRESHFPISIEKLQCSTKGYIHYFHMKEHRRFLCCERYKRAEVYVVTVLELFAKTKCEGLCNGPDASEAEHVL